MLALKKCQVFQIKILKYKIKFLVLSVGLSRVEKGYSEVYVGR